MFERFSRDIGLREDQKAGIKVIIDSSHQRMDVLMKEVGPKFKEIRTTTDAEIRKQLDTKQQQKFDELTKRYRNQPPHGPPGPPPH
ncbi:MAG: hypothetical protein WC859_07135 [Elusimicrobiota bacterium]